MSVTGVVALSRSGRALILATCAGIGLVAGLATLDQPAHVRAPVAPATVRAGEPVPVAESPSVSDDGRLVAFASAVDGLVPGDTNGHTDVFVLDRIDGTLVLASKSPASFADGNSTLPSLTGDGRYVAFTSEASNLELSDTDTLPDVFRRDLATGLIERISVPILGDSSDSAYGSSSSRHAITDDGRYVAFTSLASNMVATDTNNRSDVFLRDTQNDTTALLSWDGVEQGNGHSTDVVVDREAFYVAFQTEATNLTGEPDTNDSVDVVRGAGHSTGALARVSVGTGDVEGDGDSFSPTIGDNGEWIAFASDATNLVAGDTNAATDVFVQSRNPAVTSLMSVTPGGQPGTGRSTEPTLNSDETAIAFLSEATDLVPGDTNGQVDVFVRPLSAGDTERASVGTAGVEGNNGSGATALDATGDIAVFVSAASNLVVGDTNGVPDLFARDLVAGTTELASPTGPDPGGNLVSGGSFEPPAIPSTGGVTYISYGPPDATSLGPWTIASGGVDVVGPVAAVAADGVQFVDLNGNGFSPGTLSQDIAVEDGHTYEVSIQLSGNPNGEPIVKDVRVSFAGAVHDWSFDTTGHTNEELGWEERSYEVTVLCGGDGTEELQLESLTLDEKGPNIDAVSVVDIGAPPDCTPDCPAPGPFSDVSEAHPFCPEITWLADSGVTGGFPDGTFRPVAPITRQAMAAFLSRYDHDTADPACTGDGPFPDVPASHPFCAEIAWLADSGVTGGFDDGTFRPAAPITRQAMAAFLSRYDHDTPDPPCLDPGPFPDVTETHPFCAEIAWLADSGVTGGFDDGTFRPAAPITRQAMAAFLYRYDLG